MYKILISKTLLAFVVFPAVPVGISGLIGIPHFYFLVISLLLSFTFIIKENFIKKYVVFASLIALGITLFNYGQAKVINEFIYNSMSLINFILVFMLVSRIDKKFRLHNAWTAVLIFVIFINVIENFLFNELTSYAGRATLIGYDNPLWAGRDLCVSAAYIYINKGSRLSLSIFLILFAILFFLEARGATLSLLIFLIWRLDLLRFLTGAALVSLFIVLSWNMNRFSAADRFVEWYSILTNLDKIPLFGFGLRNYTSLGFTSLPTYSHNWVLDYMLAHGIVGIVLASLTLRGLYLSLQYKASGNLNPMLVLPLIYGLLGLTQGSLISSLLALSVLPLIGLMNASYMKDVLCTTQSNAL